MKKILSERLFVITLILVLCSSALFAGCKKQEEEVPPPPPSNPLTGELEEDGFDPSALDRRVLAIVVENAPDARPQWGLDDPEYSPDIVLQGEVEGGITRTLWFYADDTKLPEIVGPTRSARPPFIRFSELFDSIFIHWGMSYSKGDYVGANKIFQWHDVDHINQMTLDDKEGMYDRDNTRNVSSEHTGIIHTDKIPATIKNEGIRTTPEEITKLYFNETASPVSEESAGEISVTYSKQADWETTDWKYNEEDEMYHSSSFENDFKRDNLLILYDNTEYITKEDYHGSGASVTYCDYEFKGGDGILFTKGSSKKIKWQRKEKTLILIDPDKTVEDAEEDESIILAEVPLTDDERQELEENTPEGEEVQPEMYVVQPLNKGKTWIGWISANNGGKVDITPGAPVKMPEAEGSEGESADGESTEAEAE